MKKIINIFLTFIFIFSGWVNITSADEVVDVYLFGREGCNFCQLEESFLESLSQEREDFNLIYLDVDDVETKEKFNQLVEFHDLPKATPITLIGNSIIQGFSSEEITGKLIIETIDEHKGKANINLDDYISEISNVVTQQGSVCNNTEATSCTLNIKRNTEIKVPLIGVIDYKDFSLFSMAVILGFVDGFNPCAMWVLLTFLLILWQVGNRKKMLQVAGLFIVAEAVMYWAILNFWFSAWDFIGLDKLITPVVGVLAIGGGVYFLRRYMKNREKLTCDVTSVDYQSKTEQKIKDLIKSPMTILTAIGIIGVAFSVNMIEFACSVGIPQAFTKVLEINQLGVFAEQFYILLYTLFYMVDDFVIFGLALYGFEKFYTVGQKYSNLSSLVGGILMLILGALLLFNPSALVF
ncbi:glutaredoxin [Patescibacteria group bacterium]|nr:glutaredoxin [Patescibacteria group bacterium]